MTRLGKEIRKARVEKDLSQGALEALTGINFRHLSAIERERLTRAGVPWSNCPSPSNRTSCSTG